MSIQFEDLALPGIATSRNANLRTATRCPHLDSRTPTESPPPLSPSLEYCSVFPCSSHDNCRRIGVQEKKKRSFSTRVADPRHCVLLSGYQATNNAVISLRRNWTSGPWAANLPCALKATGSNICADTGHSAIMVLLRPSRRASQ